MLRYILHRLLHIVPVTFAILLVTFLVFSTVGGSPAQIVLGKNASAEALARYDRNHGFDKPLVCGRWAELDAVAAPTGNPATVAFTYPLPQGTYRLGGFVFEVGEPVSSIVVPPEFQLETPRLFVKNRHFFDSQLAAYFIQLARLDFGDSVEHERPVLQVLRDGVGPSLAISLPALVLGMAASLFLALVCAHFRARRPDTFILFATTLFLAVNPVLWVLFGQFFLAYRLRLFPIWGFDSARALVLPVLLGTVISLPRDIRFLRTLLLDEISKPYLRTAQAKGLSTLRILLRHLLPNTMIPILTYFSLSIPFLFTGSLLLESTFGIPGLGAATLNALHSADLPVIRAIVLLGALAFQFIMLLTDLSYVFFDPRIRLK